MDNGEINNWDADKDRDDNKYQPKTYVNQKQMITKNKCQPKPDVN